jgi:hypothetical protein
MQVKLLSVNGVTAAPVNLYKQLDLCPKANTDVANKASGADMKRAARAAQEQTVVRVAPPAGYVWAVDCTSPLVSPSTNAPPKSAHTEAIRLTVDLRALSLCQLAVELTTILRDNSPPEVNPCKDYNLQDNFRLFRVSVAHTSRVTAPPWEPGGHQAMRAVDAQREHSLVVGLSV